MKIYVEEVVEHTAAERVSVPARITSAGTDYCEIAGERKQAVEVIIRAVQPREDIDLWRESVGHELSVIPWEQEALVLPRHYEVSFTQDNHVVLLCGHCGTVTADIIHEWGDEYQGAVPMGLITAAALAHEKERHG